MAKCWATYFLLLLSVLSSAQSVQTYNISGIVVSSLDKQPISEATIFLSSTKGYLCDSSGEFAINGLTNGQYKLTFRAFGYPISDTIVNIVNADIKNFIWPIKTLCNGKYNRQRALDDIKKGVANLVVIGGIAPVIYPNDKKFWHKYKVGYEIFGCIAPDMTDCLVMYNRTIFEYLDRKYGKRWRKDVRKDVVGLKLK